MECWQVVGSSTDLAGVVLAAGLGTRLRPLTLVRPKPLCPVGDRPLLDHALDRMAAVAGDVAVNVHHGDPGAAGGRSLYSDRPHPPRGRADRHDLDAGVGEAGNAGFDRVVERDAVGGANHESLTPAREQQPQQ